MHIYTHTDAHLHVRQRVHACLPTRTCMHRHCAASGAYECSRTRKRPFARAHTHKHLQTITHTHTHTCAPLHACSRVRTCAHTYVCICIRSHVDLRR